MKQSTLNWYEPGEFLPSAGDWVLVLVAKYQSTELMLGQYVSGGGWYIGWMGDHGDDLEYVDSVIAWASPVAPE